ncbi:MAG: hypothetical protein ABSG14_10175 [Verrucomicrobiia bacterium]
MFLQPGNGSLFGTQPLGKFFLRQPNLFPRLSNQNAHPEFGVSLIVALGKISVPMLAIGAGVNLGNLNLLGLNTDKDGTPSPASGPWDLGVYEH